MKKGLENMERILVCLSSSPSNHRVISVAADMARAYNATLTAIYVRPTDYEQLSNADKLRVQQNIRFAEEEGASVTTIAGYDVPTQIAEYARISGTTKIVVGQGDPKKKLFAPDDMLTEQVIVRVPGVDVYIIPDSEKDIKNKSRKVRSSAGIKLNLKDCLVTLLLLALATCTGLVFTMFGFSESNIITVFILGVLVIAVATTSPIYSVVSSLVSVLLFNYFFIEPKFNFHTYEPEYAVTFMIMLISALITGTLANKLKENARHSAREAFHAKVLFDTNRFLQKALSREDAVKIAAKQVVTLLDRDVIIYPFDEEGHPEERVGVNASGYVSNSHSADDNDIDIAKWVFANKKPAGAHFEKYSGAGAIYLPIGINDHCYGVISICQGNKPLEAFEYSVFTSIMGECALALDSIRNAAESEKAATIARNEQLRSNLLRSISHDIRTPLTSISGNASNLIYHYDQLDKETREQIFSDIYDDSEWLIDLVENLLSVSRIENGQINLHMAPDVVNDVIEEAVNHLDKAVSGHRVVIEPCEELLLVRMDARLITQVLINLINNAIKNTPEGSEITIDGRVSGTEVIVSVSDDGPGIQDDIKPHIFEMFYTGQSTVADGRRRGMGLGLALCRSIVEAHGGRIWLEDNEPAGCIFRFSLPAGGVEINE